MRHRLRAYVASLQPWSAPVLAVFCWLPALWLGWLLVENAHLLLMIRLDLNDESALAIPFVVAYTLMPTLIWFNYAHSVTLLPRAPTAAREALLVLSLALAPAVLAGGLGWWLEARGVVSAPDVGTVTAWTIPVTLAGGAALATIAARALRCGSAPRVLPLPVATP